MEKYARPKYHFTPSKGWINDPNGLIFYNGVYHLFAQHYPDGNVWGPMHWLHATSSDMINWHEEGIALYPDELGLMFSGSACRMQDGRMALMYTAHSEECEQQCVAFSEDGMSFEKCASNPVIPAPGIRDFRDPKVFWNERYNCWSVVLAADDRVHFYRSNDLCKWEKTGEFGMETVRFGDRFECPDCFPLRTASGETVWVLTASMIFFDGESGCRMRYWLGEFDGDTFHETYSKGRKLRVEAGYDSYAGASWYGLTERVFQTWMHSASLPSPLKSYTGCLSLPRRCALIDTDEGPRLAFCCVLPKLNPAAAIPDAPYCVDIAADTPFAVCLKGENTSDCLKIEWTEKNTIRTERSRNAEMPNREEAQNVYNHDDFRITETARLRSGALNLRIVVDAYAVEIFADDGLYTNALLMFARGGLKRIESNDSAKISIAQI